jgi:hypothetical protein
MDFENPRYKTLKRRHKQGPRGQYMEYRSEIKLRVKISAAQWGELSVIEGI